MNVRYAIIIALVSFSATLYAEEEADQKKLTSIGIRVTEVQVNSATAKNALNMQNSLMINSAIAGVNNIMIPSASNFRGKGLEWDSSVRHTPLIRSNYLLSYSTLTSGTTILTDIDKYSYSIGYPPTTIKGQDFTVFDYSKNRLYTTRVNYGADFLIFHDSKNPFLENLSLRAGLEAYENNVTLSSKSNAYISSGTSGAITTVKNGIDFTTPDKLIYRESYLNGTLGFNYSFTFLKINKIDFGVEYFKSIQSSADFKDKSFVILSSGNTSIPLPSLQQGIVKTDIRGNRFHLGYSFQVTEALFLRLSYSGAEAMHTVRNSTATNQSGLALALLSGNSAAFLGSILHGLGPYPSSRDMRSQIGFEIGFKY
ncbi:hypothetical protein LEP1GSC058_1916 [Leptospira fainei serovar Hurstbridge str. BUT 6]|uniref:Uncharacterized protein n=1 Tax=Leptospira fainei serovar Hurstbridge str. BUT 6 TaxID=1193011 RepID=S3V1C6_9LEPT|nr:hypothetical protein LEP1GSC058_1916 [Leptospira fainei serovar Hurstbridge str. BUT 6]